MSKSGIHETFSNLLAQLYAAKNATDANRIVWANAEIEKAIKSTRALALELCPEICTVQELAAELRRLREATS